MNPRLGDATRRWQSTIAIVAALSVFVALIAGSSLRPPSAAATLPEPAAWTHGTAGVQAHADQVQLSAAAQGFSPGSTPTNKKPFHSAWMTHDRPVSWAHSSPHSGWPALQVSFGARELAPLGAHWAGSAAPPTNRDVLTRLCVARC